MAWQRTKTALMYLRSHLGHIQVITECYSTAITGHYKILNPCVLNRKSLQFCSDTHQVGQKLWTQWSPAATATPSSKNSWSRLVVRITGDLDEFLLVEIKAIFPQKCSSFCLEAVLGHSVSNWGCWSRLRHVCCWVCRAAQAPKASKNECQANQSSVSGWSPLRHPHTDIQCHLRCPWLSCLASSSHSRSARVS